MNDEADNDRLKPGELVLSDGGRWSGHLFDNPRIGLLPHLTWGFNFVFADVLRDYGSSPVSLDIDGMPFQTTDWRRMTGHTMRTDQFAEPAEASVYFFQHHRYNTVDLRILDQHEAAIQVAVTVSGDLDRLGIESLAVSGWLTFAGINVQLSTAASPDAAAERLREFTDISALALIDSSPHSILFGSPVAEAHKAAL